MDSKVTTMIKVQKCSKVNGTHFAHIFFAHKKYSRSFVKLQLNPLCPMDYFIDVLATILDLDLGISLAVYAGSGRSRILSKIS